RQLIREVTAASDFCARTPLAARAVPEHFSTVFDLAAKNGHFLRRGLEVDVVFCPGGTGEMTRLLVDGKIDVAAALTEGLVASQFTSCFGWAISTGAASSIKSVQELHGSRIGVSRFGSGSHIIPYVLADKAGWLPVNEADKDSGPNALSKFAFDVLHNFQGLRDGVNSGKVDAFLWE
ncbi:MAG: hypothetical protein BJ554DRAFT_3108, partial [Olpidium bornovanus]